MDRTLSIGTINRKLENRKSDLKYFLTNGIPVDDLLKDISKLESLQKQMVSKPKSKSKSKTVSRTNNYHNQINNLKGVLDFGHRADGGGWDCTLVGSR